MVPHRSPDGVGELGPHELDAVLVGVPPSQGVAGEETKPFSTPALVVHQLQKKHRLLILMRVSGCRVRMYLENPMKDGHVRAQGMVVGTC